MTLKRGKNNSIYPAEITVGSVLIKPSSPLDTFGAIPYLNNMLKKDDFPGCNFSVNLLAPELFF